MRKERVKISSSFKEKKGKIIRNYYENPKKRERGIKEEMLKSFFCYSSL